MSRFKKTLMPGAALFIASFLCAATAETYEKRSAMTEWLGVWSFLFGIMSFVVILFAIVVWIVNLSSDKDEQS